MPNERLPVYVRVGDLTTNTSSTTQRAAGYGLAKFMKPYDDVSRKTETILSTSPIIDWETADEMTIALA